MKRLMSLVAVSVIGMFLMAACAMAADQDEKGPVGKVVSAAADTTKKVGEMTGDTISTVSGGAVEATKEVTGKTGDVVTAVSDTTVTVTKGVTGAAGDTVETVSDTVEDVATSDIK